MQWLCHLLRDPSVHWPFSRTPDPLARHYAAYRLARIISCPPPPGPHRTLDASDLAFLLSTNELHQGLQGLNLQGLRYSFCLKRLPGMLPLSDRGFYLQMKPTPSFFTLLLCLPVSNSVSSDKFANIAACRSQRSQPRNTAVS